MMMIIFEFMRKVLFFLTFFCFFIINFSTFLLMLGELGTGLGKVVLAKCCRVVLTTPVATKT